MRSKADGGGRRGELGVPSSASRRPTFLLLWNMKNGDQIRTQLAEKRLKLDSSSLEYEIAPTRPVPAQCVSSSSHIASLSVGRWPWRATLGLAGVRSGRGSGQAEGGGRRHYMFRIA